MHHYSIEKYTQEFAPDGVTWGNLDAIEHAVASGYWICKYSDPVEGEQIRMTVDDAAAVMQEDPSLIWIETAVG